VDVHQGGHPETASCCLSTLYADSHTETLTQGASETQSMIVEVTPGWRAEMAKQGVDWRTETGHRGLTSEG
jgi:hypothetical protein